MVKTDMASVNGDFCSHIATVSQAVPAAMLQEAPWRMRTRLNACEWPSDSGLLLNYQLSGLNHSLSKRAMSHYLLPF